VLPLLATQILWINLITDTGPALAMGVDPIADDVMARTRAGAQPAHHRRRMGLASCRTGIVMALLTLLTLDLFLPGGLIEPVEPGWAPPARTARTAAFTVLVLAQLFNCFNARSETRSAFRGLFSNRWLWATVALSAALQVAVVHLPFLNLAFGTVPLGRVGGPVGRVRGHGQRVLWFSDMTSARCAQGAGWRRWPGTRPRLEFAP
jgi:Ca2+-transporting ATPase